MPVTVENISKLRYFSGIGPDYLGSIAQLFNQKVYLKGQTIVREGDQAENLHFVGSGVVKVFKTSPEGKEQIVKIIRPGESYNDVAVFSAGPCPYSAQALGTTTIIYWIHRSNLMPLLEKNGKMAMNAIEVLAEQERILLTLVEDLSFKNVVGRVAKILLQNLEPGPEGFQKLTQYEMAAMAGTAREVVGRSLKNLEDLGVIRLDKHKIVIADKDRLTRMAGVN
jgi:CRP/FNR family transcriptional regulator